MNLTFPPVSARTKSLNDYISGLSQETRNLYDQLVVMAALLGYGVKIESDYKESSILDYYNLNIDHNNIKSPFSENVFNLHFCVFRGKLEYLRYANFVAPSELFVFHNEYVKTEVEIEKIFHHILETL